MTMSNLLRLGRELAALGYCPGGSGNVSWWDGELLHLSRTGVDLGHLDEGGVASFAVDWDRRAPVGPVDGASKEFPMHIAVHARAKGAPGFVGHVHSPHAVAASCLPAYSSTSAIPPLTPYFVMKLSNVPMVGYSEPGSVRQAEEIFALPADVTTFLMQNHGLTASGTRVETVIDRLSQAEISSGTWLQVRGHDGVRVLGPDERQALQGRFHHHSPAQKGSSR